MDQFPKKLIQANLAILSKSDDLYGLSFQLNPFILNKELVNSRISFEDLQLPSSNLKDLVGLKLKFDEEQCKDFDGCFTLDGVHNPVDLHQIEFIESRSGYLTVLANISIDFEYEMHDCYENLDLVINSMVASVILE